MVDQHDTQINLCVAKGGGSSLASKSNTQYFDKKIIYNFSQSFFSPV